MPTWKKREFPKESVLTHEKRERGRERERERINIPSQHVSSRRQRVLEEGLWRSWSWFLSSKLFSQVPKEIDERKRKLKNEFFSLVNRSVFVSLEESRSRDENTLSWNTSSVSVKIASRICRFSSKLKPLFFPWDRREKEWKAKKKKTELKERKERESRSRLLLLRKRDHRNSKLFFLLFFRKTFGEERRKKKKKKKKKEKHQALPYHVVDRRVPFFSSVRRVALSLSLCLSLSLSLTRARCSLRLSLSLFFFPALLFSKEKR